MNAHGHDRTDRGELATHDVLAGGPPPHDAVGEDLVRARLRARMFGQVSIPPRLDRYVVLERLGEGSHGIVYAAYDDRLDRKVALKVLRAQTEPQIRKRFLREARALAKLAHPNVVTIYEVLELPEDGPTPGVLIAMEYVRGQSLAAWRTEPRPWPEVLDVYRQAATGLMAAHDVGLVHRDFKPANAILGNDGRVRVLDFGLVQGEPTLAWSSSVAVSVDARAPDRGSTRTGLIGTPLYMPPEQHRGEPSDAKSDQYSLCASLWEALYGQPPFEAETTEALLPAKRHPPEAPAESAVPSTIRTALLRGLSYASEDRHPDLAALLEALRTDAPRGHGRLLAGGAFVVAVGAAFMWPAQSEPCARAGERVESIWTEEARAAARDGFAQTELPYAAPTWSRVEPQVDGWVRSWSEQRQQSCIAHDEGTQSDVLFDLRSQCLDDALLGLTAQMELWAEADRSAVDKADAAVRALPELSTCADAERLHARVPRPTEPEAERQLDAWSATIASARAHRASGHYRRAFELVDGVAREYEADSIDYAPVHATALAERGADHVFLGEPEAARESLHTAAYEASAAGDDLLFAQVSASLVGLYGNVLGRFEDAEIWARLSRASLEREGGHPATAITLHNNYGNALEVAGRYDEALAEQEARRALVVEHYGEDSPMMIYSIVNTANIHIAKGELEEGLAGLTEGLERIETQLGPEHPLALITRSNMMSLLARMDRAEEAIAVGRETIAAQARLFGPDHPDRAHTQVNLALALVNRRRPEEALPLLTEARATLVDSLGPDAPILFNAGLIHGHALLDLNRIDEARAEAVQARSLGVRVLGSEHPLLATAEELLAYIELADRHFDVALEHARVSKAQFGASEHEAGVRTAEVNEAQALLGLGRASEALELVLGVVAELDPKDAGVLLAEAWTVAGHATLQTKGPDAAEPWLRQAEAVYRKREDPIPSALSDALAVLPASGP